MSGLRIFGHWLDEGFGTATPDHDAHCEDCRAAWYAWLYETVNT